jgi:hypothetical protein
MKKIAIFGILCLFALFMVQGVNASCCQLEGMCGDLNQGNCLGGGGTFEPFKTCHGLTCCDPAMICADGSCCDGVGNCLQGSCCAYADRGMDDVPDGVCCRQGGVLVGQIIGTSCCLNQYLYTGPGGATECCESEPCNGVCCEDQGLRCVNGQCQDYDVCCIFDDEPGVVYLTHSSDCSLEGTLVTSCPGGGAPNENCQCSPPPGPEFSSTGIIVAIAVVAVVLLVVMQKKKAAKNKK